MVVFGAMATGKVVGQDITDAWLDKSINLLLRNDLVGDVGLERESANCCGVSSYDDTESCGGTESGTVEQLERAIAALPAGARARLVAMLTRGEQ